MKKLLCLLFVTVLVFALSLNVFADANGKRLIDSADLLSESEEEAILTLLDQKSEEHQFDIVIVTVDSLEGKTPFQCATDYYEDGNYGFGNDYTGAILLISMEERDWYIASCGKGEDIIPDETYVDDGFVFYLSNGNYAKAFDEYIYAVDERIIEYNTMPWGTYLIISLVIGFIVAFIATAIMKGKLKTVRFQNNARDYVRGGSMNVTVSRDLYLFSTVTRRAKPKSNSSGGGRSSSGRSYGGGGGKF